MTNMKMAKRFLFPAILLVVSCGSGIPGGVKTPLPDLGITITVPPGGISQDPAELWPIAESALGPEPAEPFTGVPRFALSYPDKSIILGIWELTLAPEGFSVPQDNFYLYRRNLEERLGIVISLTIMQNRRYSLNLMRLKLDEAFQPRQITRGIYYINNRYIAIDVISPAEEERLENQFAGIFTTPRVLRN